jgi:hypothetical protein
MNTSPPAARVLAPEPVALPPLRIKCPALGVPDVAPVELLVPLTVVSVGAVAKVDTEPIVIV